MPFTEEQKLAILQAHGLNPSEYDIDEGSLSAIPRTKSSESLSTINVPVNAVSLSTKPTVSNRFTPTESFGIGVAGGVPSALGAGLGAAGLLALAGTGIGTIPAIGIGLAGAISGGALGSGIKEVVEPEEWKVAEQQAAIENPKSALAGNITSMAAGGFYPNPRTLATAGGGLIKLGRNALPGAVKAGALTGNETRALLNTGIGAGIGAAMPIGESVIHGELPDVNAVLLNTLLGAGFSEPNIIGRKLGFHPTLIDEIGMHRSATKAPQPEPPLPPDLSPKPIGVEDLSNINKIGGAETFGTPAGLRVKPKRQLDIATEPFTEGSALRNYEELIEQRKKEKEKFVPTRSAAESAGVIEAQLKAKDRLVEAQTKFDEAQAEDLELQTKFIKEKYDYSKESPLEETKLSKKSSIPDEIQERVDAVYDPEMGKARIDELQQLQRDLGSEFGYHVGSETPRKKVGTPEEEANRKEAISVHMQAETEIMRLAKKFKLPYEQVKFQSEKPEQETKVSKLASETSQRLAEEGISTRLTEGITDLARQIGLLKRNARIDIKGDVINELTGEKIAGKIKNFADVGKQSVIELGNKSKLDTPFHELFHGFVHELRLSDNPKDRALLENFEKLVSESPEYAQEKLNYDNSPEVVKARAEGKKVPEYDPEEFIASEGGLEYLNRNLGLRNETPFKTWWKDFIATNKVKWNKNPSMDEFRRVFNAEMQYRGPLKKVTTEGAKATGTTIEQNQPESELPEGYRKVNVVKPDGSKEEVYFNDKFYKGFPGGDRASIARMVNGKLSHGIAEKGSKIEELTAEVKESKQSPLAEDVLREGAQKDFDESYDTFTQVQKDVINSVKQATDADINEGQANYLLQTKDGNRLLRQYLGTLEADTLINTHNEFVDKGNQSNKLRATAANLESDKNVERNQPESPLNQTETPEFKKWFGDSKVVDSEGKPLVVYHGTSAPEFTKFNTRGYRARGYQFGEGAYFTPDKGRASAYSGMEDYRIEVALDRGTDSAIYESMVSNPSRVYPTFLKLENPYTISSDAAINDIGLKLNKENTKEYVRLAKIIQERNKYDHWQAVGTTEVGNEWIRERGYDGIIKEWKKNDPLEIVAFYPEQIKSAIGNSGAFDSTNPDIRYSAESPLRQERTSFVPFLTSRVDKIVEKIKTPTAQYVTDNLHKFSKEVDIQTGRIGNRLIESTREYTPDEIKRVYRHRHQIDDTGKSIITLTGREEKLNKSIDIILKDVRKYQNELGLKVKSGDIYRAGGMKPEGYMFNIIDPEVAYTWANKPNSAEAKAYDKAYIDHMLKKGLTEKDAKAALTAYKGALGSNRAQSIENPALRKAEGVGLPWELVEKNFNHAAIRYGNRAGRDLAYFKYIQNDPKMLRALNRKDQYGKFVEEPIEGIDEIGDNPAVIQAMRSVDGVDEPLNPTVMAGARAVANTIMGVGTAARNILNMPAFLASYVQTGQMPLLAKALSHMSESRVRAFENNAVRASFADFDAAGYYMGSPNPAIRLMNKYSEFMRKYQGRNLSDKFEGEYYYSLGELLATDNIARAKTGDKEAKRFVERFGTLSEGDLTKKPITQDDISKMAKSFVDAARGTYGEQGLPSFAIEGELSPFFALSRFSIEKANTIWKDVIEPAKKGIYGPLIRYVLGSAGVGFAIEALNEELSNKRGPEPTLSEVLKSGGKEDLLAKAISTAQLGSFAGIVSDGAQLVSNGLRGKGVTYNSPASFPLYTFVTETLGKNITDAAGAINEGQDPFEVLAKLATTLSTQSVQTARYIDNNFIHPDEAKRKEKFRDYNIWQELTDRKEPSERVKSNEFADLDKKEFKRSTDVKEAAGMIPSLVKKAMANSKDRNGRINFAKLQKELRGLKLNNYQIMPSISNDPIAFSEYYEFLRDTQGVDEAKSTLANFMKQNAVNSAKSQLVPSL